MEKASSRQNSEALVRIGSNRRCSADSKAGSHCFHWCWAPDSTAEVTMAADLPAEGSPVAATEAVEEQAGPGAAQR